jgi:hypothetical protein
MTQRLLADLDSRQAEPRPVFRTGFRFLRGRPLPLPAFEPEEPVQISRKDDGECEGPVLGELKGGDQP